METAIEQIREVSETEYAAVPIRTGHPQGEVRLIDVLLRPEVLVFEPLWTVIQVTRRSCGAVAALPEPPLPAGYRF
ncbi:hypothetical protein ACVXG7_06365 [Enterobacter hormaechei]